MRDQPYLLSACALYRKLAAGDLVLRNPFGSQNVDLDRTICSDIADGLDRVAEQGHDPRGLSWRCWHCDFVARTPEQAEEHFGAHECDRPVCVEADRLGLQQLAATNREQWTALRKSESQLEQAEYERDCYAQVARKLTGKPEASWHDLGDAGEALIRAERDRLAAVESLLAHILTRMIAMDPVWSETVFEMYDPQLIGPREYLASLEKRK